MNSESDLQKAIQQFEHWRSQNPEKELDEFLRKFAIAPLVAEQLKNMFSSRPEPDATVGSRSQKADLLETKSFALDDVDGARRRIGNYRLLEEIGTGGMGTVWLAEQLEPVQRRVALKLIKSEFVSRDEIARFEAERQALALMDHPSIAKVLDAGTTNEGTPYFVMEYVKGIPVTDFCDKHNLSIRDRLQLLIPICRAVQHAHQKGIIHRDLKPTNILVAEIEGFPVPKVIDFGLAKALDHTRKLTDKTLFTEIGKVVGTLQYMSPEQASLNSNDIDTRTDIYSLGIVLYELLTGSTPLDRETIRQQAILKILELIKAGDTPKPSDRLGASGDAITGIGSHRQIEPRKLQSILRGELDWVVMKALEKDRKRRYETAASFADDIHRFLIKEPVVAKPPSRSYRLSKFVSRNRGAVAATFLILMLGIAGIMSVIFAWREAVRAEGLARDNEKQAVEFSQKLAASQENANAAISQLAGNLSSELNGFHLEKPLSKAESTRSGNPLVRSRNSLATLYAMLGFHFRQQGAPEKEWSHWFQKSVDQFEQLENDQELEPAKIMNYATALDNLAYYCQTSGNPDLAIKYGRKQVEVLADLKKLEGVELKNNVLQREAAAYLNLSNYENAFENNSRAIELLMSVDNRDAQVNAGLARALHNRAIARQSTSPRDAELDLLRAIELLEKLDQPSDLIQVYNQMALLQRAMQNEDKADFYRDKSIEIAHQIAEAPDSSSYALNSSVMSLYNSGVELHGQDKTEEALLKYEQVISILQDLFVKDPSIRLAPTYYQCYWNRAEAYLEQKRFDEAASGFAEAISAVEASRNKEFLNDLPYLKISLLACQAETDAIVSAKSLDQWTNGDYRGKGQVLVKLAAIYSRAAAADQEESAKQDWIDKGMEILAAAKSQGLLSTNYLAEINTGPDFESLRSDQGFKSIMEG